MFRKLRFLFVVTLGALFGLAFAPKKGSELRDELHEELTKGGSGKKTFKKNAAVIGQDFAETSLTVYNDPEVQKKIKAGTIEALKYAKKAQAQLMAESDEWVKLARKNFEANRKLFEKETSKALDTIKKKVSKR